MLYAIVDIETTGSYAAGSGITEICIVVHDGRAVLDTYCTLVNPGRPIPRFIQAMTGISEEMVECAPAFSEIAEQVYGLLQGKVFVAHNVNFDYSFVKHHLERWGYMFDARKLCTVRLSRKIIPGLRSYSLGKLCRSVGVEHTDHHRAAGDATATARLFSLLHQRDEAGHIPASLRGRNKESYLPPHLPVEEVDALPDTPGVYYFYSAAGKLLYIGKAKNLAQRVKSHFSNNKPGRQKADFLRHIHRIAYTPVATDLMAHILESTEIRKLWPEYNRSQRGYTPQFGLFCYEDRQGYLRLGVEKSRQHTKAVHTFNTVPEGHRWLRQLITEFGLCPRLCNLAKEADCSAGRPADGCEHSAGGCAALGPVDAYNAKVLEATAWVTTHLPTFAFVDAGREEDEQSCILVRCGVLCAMGYLPADTDPATLTADALAERLDPLADNDYIRALLYKAAAEEPHKRIAVFPAPPVSAGGTTSPLSRRAVVARTALREALNPRAAAATLKLETD